MKNRYITSIMLFTFLVLTSCSVEDLINEEPNNTEILTSNSPWEFESFELITILEKENDTITEAWVEKVVNDTYQNLAFTFKEDGTGVTTLPNEKPFTWSWAFSGDNTICFDGACGNDSMTGIQLTAESLRFELVAASPEDANGNSTAYRGSYVFR